MPGSVFQVSESFMVMNKSVFSNFLALSVMGSLFLFNGDFFKPIAGVAMRSSLYHHEQLWLGDAPVTFKPILFRRDVVDSLFAAFLKR